MCFCKKLMPGMDVKDSLPWLGATWAIPHCKLVTSGSGGCLERSGDSGNDCKYNCNPYPNVMLQDAFAAQLLVHPRLQFVLKV